ncbi:MAG: flagellar assembly protein FliW [Desulfobulbaceae bacterium]|nr:MAG: flagellar assembly protein FliW [Desulfobulbaceae bacterium]
MIIEETAPAQPEITSGRVFTFPVGIPGFEEYTKFCVYHKEENGVYAWWLESIAEPTITFTLVDPTVYDLHYELRLSDEEQQILQADNAETCAVFMMLSKKDEDGSGSTKLSANIAGPLVINLESQMGMQKVITGNSGSVSVIEN